MLPMSFSGSASSGTGDASQKGSADIYFGSPMAVGSGASASASQDRSQGADLIKFAVIGVIALIGLAIFTRRK